MVSAFASQLQAIAKKSTNELNLKARRNAHAESLLFERNVAVKQDFDLLYNLCNAGYQELCQLDARFRDFERSLFSEHSKNQDRDQMSRAENDALDALLQRCMMLLGGRILLKPAVKALEWLVRRFKVHIHNVDDLLMTLLPYHEVNIWATALSIVPNDKATGVWKFLRPYLKTTWNIPRYAIAHAVSTDDAFFARFNSFQLSSCQEGLEYPLAMKFWSGILVEAISHRLRETRSGRKDIQNQRTQDLLHKILPLLSEAFDVPGSLELTTTCYTITILLAAKVNLEDNVLDSLMLAVAHSFEKVDHDGVAALVTLIIILDHKREMTMPRKVVEQLASLEALPTIVKLVHEQHSCTNFLVASVKSAIASLKRKNTRALSLLATNSISLLQQLGSVDAVPQAVGFIVAKLASLDSQNAKEAEIYKMLVRVMQDLSKNSSIFELLTLTIPAGSEEAAFLEAILGAPITLPITAKNPQDNDVRMSDVSDHDENASEQPATSVPAYWSRGSSFLASSENDAFDSLSAAFAASLQSESTLLAFRQLPIWTSITNPDLLWQTFLIRTACSAAVSTSSRTKAIRLLIETLGSNFAINLHSVVMYSIVLLSSEAKSVRRAASDLLVKCHVLLRNGELNTDATDSTSIYENNVEMPLPSVTQQQSKDILDDILRPHIEECALDAQYVIKVLRDSFHPQSRQAAKKSHVSALFTMLTDHALCSPLVSVQVIAIQALDATDKVGSKSKLKILSPVLHQWLKLSDEAAIRLVAESGLSLPSADSIFVSLLDLQHDRELSLLVEGMFDGDSLIRQGCLDAIFTRVRSQYNSCDAVSQQALAMSLFDLSVNPSSTVSGMTRDVLNTIELDTDSLASLLQHAKEDTAGLRAPPSKRRRRSSSSNAAPRQEVRKAIDGAASRITLALELIHANKPDEKPQLVNDLFEMLNTLRDLQAGHIESPYLLNLCLASIAAVLQATKPRPSNADLSGVKPELVTDCLRNSDNSEVQNTALLVLAALSVVAPDKMVHNVMPIFTFIGRNMLSKDDEHSVNVINDAIDKIVPALLANLKKGKNTQSFQASLASMIASFTAAYDHIPGHRRVAFYQKLIRCVNARESGYMLVALLADQRAERGDLRKPLQDIMSIHPAEDQLLIYQQLLHIAVDVLGTTPQLASIVFNTSRSTTALEKAKYSKSTLTAALNVLSTPSLGASIARNTKFAHDESTDTMSTNIQKAFESTMMVIRNTKSASTEISTLAKQTMDVFLTLPSTRDLFKIVASRLDDMDQELKPQALRIVALQAKNKSQKTSQAHTAAMTLLDKLMGYLRIGGNSPLSLASLSCVDQIVETYGRKDPEHVIAVSQAIIDSIDVAGSKEATAQLLTLAGSFEVLKEAAVPLVPSTLDKLIAIASVSAQDATNSTLWSALFTLVAAIFSHAAFMVTEHDLARLLPLLLPADVVAQAPADFEVLANTIGRRVDLDVFVKTSMAITRNHTEGISIAILSLLSRNLDAAAKSTVIKQADSISELFLQILDGLTKIEEGSETITELKETTMKYVYKLNDTTFRPIFEIWVEWSSEDNARQLVLFDLLTHFFDTLKAIVTSYAAYLLKPISSILSAPDSRLKQTLSLLTTITRHDQDGFFAAPSRFETIATPLVALLGLAAQKSARNTTSQVISTIVSLATSTLDSPSTHSTIASHLVKFKNSDSAQVRLASIQSFVAMTEDEELGDEFVSNVVGIGAGEGEGARGGGSVGEIMVYVNEMLEDDDEEVEYNVRKWVQLVRAKVGEDVFEV